MSTIAVKKVKLGDNADLSKNFLVEVPAVADGTLTIKRENGAVGLSNFADDAAAASGGVPVGGLYRNGSVVMIRVV